QVLTGGVTSRVVEAQVHQRSDDVLANVGEPSRPGGALRRLSYLLDMLIDPPAELTGLQCIPKREGRGPLHALFHDGCSDPAALGEEPHAAVVAGHEGPLGRGQRYEEVAVGVLAVDANGPCHSNRYLRHP